MYRGICIQCNKEGEGPDFIGPYVVCEECRKKDMKENQTHYDEDKFYRYSYHFPIHRISVNKDRKILTFPTEYSRKHYEHWPCNLGRDKCSFCKESTSGGLAPE